MKIRLENIVAYLMAARSIFVANKVAVMAYYKKYQGTWQTTVLDPQIAACEDLIGVHTLQNTSKSETIIIKNNLKSMLPRIDDCELFVEAGIEDGSITDTVATFGFDALRAAIKSKKMGAVHTAYLATTIIVGNNQPALTVLLYLPARWGIITSNEDSAYISMAFKIDLKTEISETSAADQLVYKTALATTARMIRVMNRWGKFTSNAEIVAACTQKAVLKSVTPTPAQKPRYRYVKAGESICVQQNPVLRNTVQVTLMSKNAEAVIGRTANKTDVVVDGLPLVYNTLVAKKFMDFPGELKTDKCLVITNNGAKKIKVLFFTVKV